MMQGTRMEAPMRSSCRIRWRMGRLFGLLFRSMLRTKIRTTREMAPMGILGWCKYERFGLKVDQRWIYFM